MPFVESQHEFVARHGGREEMLYVEKYRCYVFRDGAFMTRDGETRVDPPEDEFLRLRNQFDYHEQELLNAKREYMSLYRRVEAGEFFGDDSKVAELKEMASNIEGLEARVNRIREERDDLDPKLIAARNRARQEAESARLREIRLRKLAGLPVFADSVSLDEN